MKSPVDSRQFRALSRRFADKFLGVLGMALLSCSLAQAGKGREGGDPMRLRNRLSQANQNETLLRKQLIEIYLDSGAREAIALYFADRFEQSIQDPVAKRQLDTMTAHPGWSDDFFKSQYVLSDSCVDEDGNQVSASSRSGDLNGPICFNPLRLAAIKATRAEILGLILHEHAHHFGFKDEDDRFYEAVFKSIRVRDPSWAIQDPRVTEADTTFAWEYSPQTARLQCHPRSPSAHPGLTFPVDTSLCKSREKLFRKVKSGVYATRARYCALDVNPDSLVEGQMRLLVAPVGNPHQGNRCSEKGNVKIYECDLRSAQCGSLTDGCVIQVSDDGSLIQSCKPRGTQVIYSLF